MPLLPVFKFEGKEVHCGRNVWNNYKTSLEIRMAIAFEEIL